MPDLQPSATLASADRAVYAAKATGRDRMCWADGPETFGLSPRIGGYGLASINPRPRRSDDAASA